MKWMIATFLLGVVIGQLSQDRSLKLGGYRLGFGNDGYTIQRTSDWSVVSKGWFPWRKPLIPETEGDIE